MSDTLTVVVADVVKKINDILVNSQIHKLLIEELKSNNNNTTVYLDYNELPEKLVVELHSMGDFTNFSTHFCEALKLAVAEIEEDEPCLNTRLKKHDMRLRLRNFQYNTDDNDFFNVTRIHELGSNYMRELIVIRGTVMRVSDKRVRMKKTKFRCYNCDMIIDLDFNSPRSVSLNKCVGCQTEESFTLIPSESINTDAQVLTIEELPIDTTKTPLSIDVMVDGDLVGEYTIGDVVAVSGNLRFDVFDESVINQVKRKISTNSYQNRMVSGFGGQNNGMEFKNIFEANHITRLVEKNIKFYNMSDEEREAIEQLKKNPHLIDILVRSFSPDTYGEEIKKEALIYQQVGGLGRSISPKLDKRGDIHILLFGDSGTAKTMLMLFAMEMAAKTRYAVGRNITRAGLTGGIDTENNNTLTAGDAVIADLLVLDELSDVQVEPIQALKEIMEKQTATITMIKHMTFPTRVSVLSSSNPKSGTSYNPRKNFNENLGMGHALMTRFDVIFLFRDIPGLKDKKIIGTILDSYDSHKAVSEDGSGKPDTITIPKNLLAKFLFLARNSGIVPKLTPEAKEAISKYAERLRGMNLNDIIDSQLQQTGDEVNPVSFSFRQVESLVRFATARSRLRFSDITDEIDVEAAIRLMNHMLETIGIDVTTGKIDQNAIFSTKSASQENRENQALTLLEQLASARQNKIDKGFFIRELKTQSKWKDSTNLYIESYIKGLERRNVIIVVNDIISLINEQ